MCCIADRQWKGTWAGRCPSCRGIAQKMGPMCHPFAPLDCSAEAAHTFNTSPSNPRKDLFPPHGHSHVHWSQIVGIFRAPEFEISRRPCPHPRPASGRTRRDARPPLFQARPHFQSCFAHPFFCTEPVARRWQQTIKYLWILVAAIARKDVSLPCFYSKISIRCSKSGLQTFCAQLA